VLSIMTEPTQAHHMPCHSHPAASCACACAHTQSAGQGPHQLTRCSACMTGMERLRLLSPLRTAAASSQPISSLTAAGVSCRVAR